MNVVVTANGIPDGPVCEPLTEVCDGEDNDCDELVDENLQRTCAVNSNIGVQSCNVGVWESCQVQNINTYTCLDESCAQDINGLYPSAEDCLEACIVIEGNESGGSAQKLSDIKNVLNPSFYKYYTCNEKGMCVQDDNGAHIASNCNNECLKPSSKSGWLVTLAVVAVIYFAAIKGKKTRLGRRRRKMV